MWQKKIIEQELKKVVDPLGIKVVELFVKENKSGLTINVVIEKVGGVTIDDCEKVTRLLNDRLSILDDFDIYNYRLQVSSPGLSRVFKSKEEFNIFKGRDVKIILKEPLDGLIQGEKVNKISKIIENGHILGGILLGIEDSMVKIKIDDEIVEIPYVKIQKTKLNG